MMTEPSRSFPPVAGAHPRVMILGSMPGRASLAAGQYYAHPRNAFWPIMADLLGLPAQSPYPERLTALAQAGIALWDVLHECRRPGSLDTSIEAGSTVANDLVGYLGRHPHIHHIFFNGAAAESVFRRLIPANEIRQELTLIRLPSTSPANAGVSVARKLTAWRAVTDALAGEKALEQGS